MITHRDLCRAAAAWLLHDARCFAACYEVGVDGGQVDAIGITLPEPDAAAEALQAKRLRAHAAQQARFGDIVTGAIEAPSWERAWALRQLGAAAPKVPCVKASRPRIVVIECKRTRSDLLADLRVQKLRVYERTATNGYLLVTDEVFRVGPADERLHGYAADERRLADLDASGLPPGWGVMLARPGTTAPQVEVLRKSRPFREASVEEVRLWGAYMLRSMSYRVCRAGPMREEAEPT